MSYIQNNLQAGEVIKYKADYSLVYIRISGNTVITGCFLFFCTDRFHLLYRFTSVIVGTVPVDKKSSSKDGG